MIELSFDGGATWAYWDDEDVRVVIGVDRVESWLGATWHLTVEFVRDDVAYAHLHDALAEFIVRFGIPKYRVEWSGCVALRNVDVHLREGMTLTFNGMGDLRRRVLAGEATLFAIERGIHDG